MEAIITTSPGGPEVLQIKHHPTPEPDTDEVLIKVKAAGLNRADVNQRLGNYPAPAGVSDILGMEVAGTVVKCGSAVTLWKVGDDVCALLAGGGYAEFVTAKEGVCLPIPVNFTYAQAASLPETVFTVWSTIFKRGKLRTGEKLLVHGGNSGIGITAIQLGKAFGSKVFVTVGTKEKGEICLQLGAQAYVNYKTEDFEAELRDEGIDVILDIIGGKYFEKNINILSNDGRLIYINTIGGNLVNLDLSKVMAKRLFITGSSLRSRNYAFKKDLARDIFKHVWPLMNSGAFKPVIFKTFPFSEVVEAHRLLESGTHTGKIVLTRV